VKTAPRLTVVIPTLNREQVLLDTIKQILSDRFKELELIVVDQTLRHKPATKRALEAIRDDRFRYYLVTPPSGVAAKNFALQRARAPLTLFLDDDIDLSPQCITEHVKALDKDPELMGVAGRVTQADHEQTDTLLHFDKYGLSHGRFNYKKRQYTDTMPGGNMSVRTEAALAVGGFSTNFLRSQHREESEFCVRYHRRFPKIIFEPKAKLEHLEAPYGGTRIKTDFADNPDFYKNNLYFMLRKVSLKDLPAASLKQLRLYALRKNPILTLRRVPMFIIGYVTALKRMVWPVKIVSEELPWKGSHGKRA
jgi:glycosyltransferase involved in cell wall biosynthesis